MIRYLEFHQFIQFYCYAIMDSLQYGLRNYSIKLKLASETSEISIRENARTSIQTDLDGVFALGQGVPQLDGLVPGSGDDLPVVGRESDGHNVLGVVLEPEQN